MITRYFVFTEKHLWGTGDTLMEAYHASKANSRTLISVTVYACKQKEYDIHMKKFPESDFRVNDMGDITFPTCFDQFSFTTDYVMKLQFKNVKS